MSFAAAAGPCMWGPGCHVPDTHGHWCTRCELSAHTACTYRNVMAFATRHRGTGADGERQYARAVETADVPGCPLCLELPGVAYSVQKQGGLQTVVARISRDNANATVSGGGGSGGADVATSVESATPSRRTRSNPSGSGRKCASTSTRAGAKRPRLDEANTPGDPVVLATPDRTTTSTCASTRPVKRTRGVVNVPEPPTTAAPMSEPPAAMTESSETVATPPFDSDNTDLGAAVPPRETVSTDSTSFVSAGAKTAGGTGKTASDTGASAAGACTSRSSALLVFGNLQALLLEVVICCVYTRVVRVLTRF
jgi:hypothetical protein